MKNAMKRIMGLLLVAVLLVSVVPFQALADEINGSNDYKGFEQIVITVNDDVKVNKSWVEEGGNGPRTKTVKDILNAYFPEWSNGDYGFKSAMYNGQNAALDTTLHSNCDDTSVAIALYTIPRFTVNVTYYRDGTNDSRGSHDFTGIKQGASLSFSDIAAQNPEPTAYKVDRVVYNNGANTFSSGSITVNDNMWLTAYLVGIGGNSGNNGGSNNGNTSVLKANYYIDGNYKQTKDYDVEHKYISELVEMGGYKASDYAKVTASVDGSDKGTENVLVKNGQTVNIYMTTKTNSTKLLTASYYIDGGYKKTSEYDVDGKKISELITDSKLGGYSLNNYDFASASVGGTSKGLNDVIYRGETVNIYLATKSSTTPDSRVLKAEFYINGSYKKTGEYNVDGKTVRELITDSKLGNYDIDDYSNITANVNGSNKLLGDVIYRGEVVKIYLTKKTTNNKFPYDVVLNVYLNNSVGEPDKRININDLAADGVISMSEVQNLLTDKYYKAKNSRGIDYDGLYLARGNWVEAFSRDYDKYEKITGVDEMRKESRIDINVMLTNATRKTSSTADSSNPKTGDAIFMTITVMGLSAAALTGLYFYDKKRKAL